MKSNIDLIGGYSGLLALTEVGCGAVLHAFHLPFTGSILSLNQIFILNKASIENDFDHSRFDPFIISSIAAVLKSLAPIGKKLTPMLAIGMQGALFNIGIILFGHSLFGRLIGAALASLWGFIQPLLLYYLIFGNSIFEAFKGLVKDFSQFIHLPETSLYFVLAGIVALKMLLAIGIVIFTPRLPHSWISGYLEKMSKSKVSAHPKRKQTPLLGALKDLCKPTFLFALIITALFFFWSENSYTVLIWHLLRPLAVGFICFFALRWLPLEGITTWLELRYSNLFTAALKIALKKIRD